MARGSAATRQALRFHGSLSLLLALAALALLAYLSNLYNLRLDWTASGRNSLAPASVEVLRALEQPVSIRVYAREDEQLRAPLRDVLERYRAASDQVQVAFVDPARALEEVRTQNIRSEGTVLVQYRGRSEKLEQLDESSLSNALVRLARAGERRLTFLAGHGERAPDGGANHDLGSFVSELRQQGVQVDTLEPGTQELAPDSVLVIAGPQVPLLAGEVARLQRFVEAGGSLLWLLDSEPPGSLQPLAERLGIRQLPGVIVDPVGQIYAGDPTFVLATPAHYQRHATTERFEFNTLFPIASGLEFDAAGDWQVTPLIEAAAQGWSETEREAGEVEFDPERDIAGPLVLAAALERGAAAADDEDAAGPAKAVGTAQRVIVVGDGDFLSNQFLANGGNLNLGLNFVNWLAGDDSHINIPPKTAADRALELGEGEIIAISAGFLFVAPLGLLGCGLLLWWRRRRRE